MKTFLLLLVAVFLTAPVEAATPSYSNFDTNSFSISGINSSGVPTNPVPIISVKGGAGGGGAVIGVSPIIVTTTTVSGSTTNFVSAPTLATTNYVNQLLASNNFPFIQMFQGTNYIYNGVLYHPTNSQTAGIQEALNKLPVAQSSNTWAGGTIFFAPGVYYTYTNIQLQTASNPFTLDMEGSGMSACGITYVGTQTQDVFTVGYPGTPSMTIFSMKNMWMASAVNGCTNILHLNGHATSYATGSGGVAKCNIDFCWFGYWVSMTNASNEFGFSPSTFGDGTTKHNLIPVNIDCNWNENMLIQNCQFTYVNGISYMSDHGQIENNVFEFVGGNSNCRTNDWPTNSLYAAGAGAYFVNGHQGFGEFDNGNDGWLIQGNNWVGCQAAYVSDAHNAGNATALFSDYDTFESGPNEALVLVTGTNKWQLNNPRGYSGINSYDITNTSDYRYSAWHSKIDTNLVTLNDLILGTNGVPTTFNAAIVFTGDVTGVPPTALNAGTTFNNVFVPTNSSGTHGYSGFMTNGVFVQTSTY